VVHLVTNDATLHAYSARRVYEALGRGAASPSLVRAAASLLGEHGAALAALPGGPTLGQQVEVLLGRFVGADPGTKASPRV
jgi:hypothetical protein